MDDLLLRLLEKEEGFRRSAYTDHLGYWTLGIGKCIDARKGCGITHEEALYLLENEVRRKEADLNGYFPWFPALDQVRRCVLLSMAFQMGTMGLLAFRQTLRAVEEKRWGDAADGMLMSLWARQTPARALRLSEAMRTGSAAAFRLD